MRASGESTETGQLQYSTAAVGQLCTAVESYSAQGTQAWATVGACPAASLGRGFESYAQRLNAAVESRKTAATKNYARFSEYAPAISVQWQNFDAVDADSGHSLRNVGDQA